MTVSFHRYGGYFPGTGSPTEIGSGHGKYHTLNVPFSQGLHNEQFWSVFEPVMQKVMDTYQPGAIVLQCGKIVIYLCMKFGYWQTLRLS